MSAELDTGAATLSLTFDRNVNYIDPGGSGTGITARNNIGDELIDDGSLTGDGTPSVVMEMVGTTGTGVPHNTCTIPAGAFEDDDGNPNALIVNFPC